MTGTAQKIKQKLKEVTSPSPPPVVDTPSSSPQHKSSSISNLLHHKSNSTSTSQSGVFPPGQGAPIQPIESGDSIASDPSNYLTDQQLEQDLVLEEMADREHEIGHQGRSGSTVSAPPAIPAPAPAEKPSGGMYGGNLFGHGGGGGGGKKKGSKQKFAERQVS
jgi:hypothetical protein